MHPPYVATASWKPFVLDSGMFTWGLFLFTRTKMPDWPMRSRHAWMRHSGVSPQNSRNFTCVRGSVGAKRLPSMLRGEFPIRGKPKTSSKQAIWEAATWWSLFWKCEPHSSTTLLHIVHL